jgi:hypothetical protein
VKHHSLTCLVVLASLTLVAACGGGGGGNNNPTPPPPPAGITYTAAGNPTTGALTLQAGEVTATQLTLRLEARAVTGLNGLACDVVFPAGLRYESFVAGEALTSDGASQSIQVIENPVGRLVIGATRLGSGGGLASAQGTVLSLRFASAATGSGSIAFQSPTAFDGRGGSLGVEWVGGSVNVVR